MKFMHSSPVWGIEPMSLQKRMNLMVLGQLVKAGPADDAERQGFPLQVVNNLAIIKIHGVMAKVRFWFDEVSTSEIAHAIMAAGDDPGVEAVILRIDSPGGDVDGTDELAQAINHVGQKKKVIAVAEGMIASAAFWAASQATEIVAGRLHMIGSIGVRIMLFDEHKMFEDMGVEAVPIDTGEFKSAGAIGTEITERQRADFQRLVDGIFTHFRSDVMEGREMSAKQFNVIGDGRIFLGEEAVDLNLIDRIASLKEIVAENIKVEPRRSAALAQAELDLAALTG